MAGLDKRWRMFMQDVCFPLFSAVCTAPLNDVETHPAEEFLGAFLRSMFIFDNKLPTSWPNVAYTHKLLRLHMAHIYDAPLRRLTRCP